MYRILVVDDLRQFTDVITADVTYARTSKEAIELLRRQKWSQVWLDHDLGENDDIRPVVRFLLTYKPKIDQVYVQSMNPVGAHYIVDSLKEHYVVALARSPHLVVPERESND